MSVESSRFRKVVNSKLLPDLKENKAMAAVLAPSIKRKVLVGHKRYESQDAAKRDLEHSKHRIQELLQHAKEE